MKVDRSRIIQACRVPPGKKVNLKEHDPAYAGDKKIPKAKRKELAEELLSEDVTALSEAQELLYSDDRWSLLVIFQALDAAGKDGAIKHVMTGVNPQGTQVYSFKHPSSEELDHNFLWRCMKCLPERGRIGIFNRSYYEEVLIVKVHPHLVAAQRIPDADVGPKFWEARYEDINTFERHLTRNGTVIVKFFLNVSYEEQRERFLKRINDPQKHWKFSASDIAERAYWDDYQKVYEECLSATSTAWAPWYIVPADHKWVTRAIVAATLVETLTKLDLNRPPLSPEQRKALASAKKQLEAEKGAEPAKKKSTS